MPVLVGLSPEFKLTEQGTGAHTASVQLPAGCHISVCVQGPVRPDAAAAKAAAAWKVLQQLQEPGHLAGYWGSAALLQQAGVEGGLEGGEAGSEAVLWRCEVCGVPATSARNLEVRLLHTPKLCIMHSSVCIMHSSVCQAALLVLHIPSSS